MLVKANLTTDDKLTEYGVEHKELYVVQAVSWEPEGTFFYINPFLHTSPYPFESRHFIVMDNHLPNGWAAYITHYNNKEYGEISFPEWINDRGFYERWTNVNYDHSPEAKIMIKYRQEYEIRYRSELLAHTKNHGRTCLYFDKDKFEHLYYGE